MRARTRSFVIAGVAASVVGAVTFGILRDPVAAAPPPPDLPGSENTSLVSAGVGGSAPNGPSWGAAMSSNARFVTFLSLATNLVDDDNNGLADPDLAPTSLTWKKSVPPSAISQLGCRLTSPSRKSKNVGATDKRTSSPFANLKNCGWT